MTVRYRPQLEPELLDELRGRLVGVAGNTTPGAGIPDGAPDWWARQAAAADDVLPRVVELVEEAMRRRVAIRAR